ncbi:uncharacterized protein HMPREF1541_06843 [Cyphellophora europaea CBS 101466]|uniref:t-SNARE coiled-coil homology domain-containing protein n=1 Tax=Cyphellophora europaea (strain CBS 101466) TaxID=1220924 RepID=W2RSV4_CYPE1|nr:uncharacterized protein HMPREF1541_06843 [Cyphellophora europaea CBS 101466]ETN38804.1 hypothetical protein HMPREF1541_06843 [Cyphellophora europaea CBS 101466]
MSYNQGGQQAYGSYNPYGQNGNPYGDSGNPYAQQGGNQYPQQGGYGRPPMQPQGSSNYQDPEQGNAGYEMSNMNGNDPNRLLNECRNIDRTIDELEEKLERLKLMHRRAIDDAATNSNVQTEVESQSSDIMNTYRAIVARVKKIKQDPESGNPRNAPQVGKVDRRIKTMINRFQQADSDHRKKLNERSAREYRIVRPDASDAEVREAIEDSGNQAIFSQALINSDRRGQAQNISNNVRSRHQAIQKIEQDMIMLAQLYQDLETQVIQQEPAVQQIEQRGEEVNDHVAKANTELDGAVTKARAARRKKWWCLGIVVVILIIIAIVLGIAIPKL